MKHKLALLSLLVITAGIRCLHLAVRDHFPIVNPDSHYFMALARQNPSWFQNGLAPLLSHTGMWGAMIIPPLIGVATAVLIYWLCSKAFNKNIALIATFVWAVFQPAFTASLAGNVDADSLSIFLVLLALTIYFFARSWIGAVWAGLVALLSYATWSWIGAGVIGFIIFVSACAEYWQNKRFERPQVLLTLGIGAILIVPFFLTTIWGDFSLVLQQGSVRVAEMQPINAVLLFPFFCFLPFPLAFGFRWIYNNRVLHVTGESPSEVQEWLKKRNAMIFFTAWVAACLIMGLAAYRLVQFVIPAACIIAAWGFSLLWQDKVMEKTKKRAAVVFSIAMLIISASFAVDLPENITMPNAWVDACYWLRANTKEDTKIMTWWDGGYWIENVAERESLTDGGEVRDTNTHHYIGKVYCATSDSYAAAVMKEYGTEYIVFSTTEEHFFSTIEAAAGQSRTDGLYERSKMDKFESPHFVVVYRTDDVWILKTECTTCGGK